MSITGLISVNPNAENELYKAANSQTVYLTLVNTSTDDIDFKLQKNNLINKIIEDKVIKHGQVLNYPISLYVGGSLSVSTIHPGLKAQIRIPGLALSKETIELGSSSQVINIQTIDYDKVISALIYSECGRVVFDSKYVILDPSDPVPITISRLSRGNDVIVITMADIALVKRIEVTDVEEALIVNTPSGELVDLYYSLRKKNK